MEGKKKHWRKVFLLIKSNKIISKQNWVIMKSNKTRFLKICKYNLLFINFISRANKLVKSIKIDLISGAAKKVLA